MKTVLIGLASTAVLLLFLIVVALLRTGAIGSTSAPNANALPPKFEHTLPNTTDSATSPPIERSQPDLDQAAFDIAPTDKDDFWSTIESTNESGPMPTIDLTNGPTTEAPWVSELEQELDEGLQPRPPAPSPQSPAPTKDPELQLTLEQTAKISTSLRNRDFPNTYISRIDVDLTSPNHWVRLTWSGPNAASQEIGPFHSSPGRGLGNNNCDDVAESRRQNSNCTPKGTMHVQGFSDDMRTCRQCKFVTWFNIPREVAFHYYPDVPNYPASHGCVRLEEMHAAQLIHNNSRIGATEVVVDGTWTFRY